MPLCGLVQPRRLAAPAGPHLQAKPDLSAVLQDSPIVHAHVRAADAPQKKEAEPARGCSRGGFGTQILILADRRGRPLHLRVTGVQHHDSTQARVLVEDRGVPALPDRDRSYDRDSCRAWLAQRDIEAVFPAWRGSLNPHPHDPERYLARKSVARGLGGLQPWCRVATRYDLYAPRCLGFLYLATAWIGLQS